jgi:hypothetical protein
MDTDILSESEHMDTEPIEQVDVPMAIQVDAPKTTDVPIVTPKLSNADKIALSISPYTLQEIYKLPKSQNHQKSATVQMPRQLLDFALMLHYCPYCCEPLANLGSHARHNHIDIIYQCHSCKRFFKAVNSRKKAKIHFQKKCGRGFDAEAVATVVSCMLAGSTYTVYKNQVAGEGKMVR